MTESRESEIDRISHHIASLSVDMHKIRKVFIEKEKKLVTTSRKDKKRKKSLSLAQKKFKNVSTNLKIEEYENFEKRLLELNLNKSAYLKKLILEDFEKAKKDSKGDLETVFLISK